MACIELQGRRRSDAGGGGNLAGAGASGATKGFDGGRVGAVVGGLLTETAVKHMSCSRSSSFDLQWTSPSPGRSTWCPLFLRWKARMAVSVCCCCARAWLWRRSRCGAAHFGGRCCVAGCELAGSLQAVRRRCNFIKTEAHFALAGDLCSFSYSFFSDSFSARASRRALSRDFATLSVSRSHALVPRRRTRSRLRRTRSSEPLAHPRRVPYRPARPPR